ncbi:putative heavy metal tolerance protein precursor [Podospora australis]|uniref:Heavy metal tolerance protein n=1 Tax=Podospora australis TaxID=1536484 RepID=A0AAN6WXV8_9PEZI|nr:putative heavy metal tolerance protein precursor [Podospora australis]
MDSLLENSSPEQSTSIARIVFLQAQLCYPVVLLLAFIVSAGFHSVATSRTEEELVVPTARGPGGKPLPITKRKREQRDPSPSGSAVENNVEVPAGVFRYLTLALIISFVANCIALATHTLSSGRISEPDNNLWWCDEERAVYVIGSAFFYLYVLITLFESRPTVVHLITWFLGLLGEVILLLAFLVTILNERYAADDNIRVVRGSGGSFDTWDIVDLSIGTARICIIVFLLAFYTILTTRKYLEERRFPDEEANRSDSDESSPLLTHTEHCNGRANPGRPRNNSDYGGTNINANSTASSEAGFQQCDQNAAFYRPEKLPHKTWFEYCRGYTIFFPYLWPGRSTRLKLVVLVCFILVILQRVINVLVPAQVGNVIRTLDPTQDPNNSAGNVEPAAPWKELGFLIVYKLLQGPSGLLGSIRSILWIPVSQHTYRALTTAAFEHVHSLSLDFHLGKRTGEVLSALNKGASINQFLEQVTFQVLPMLIDLFVAIVFFYVNFGPKYALFVSVITFYYLYLTIRMAATRADQRRDMVNADREEEAVKNDSITSYETVKYFNAEAFEFQRYRSAIRNFQTAEAKVTWGINHMNMCQSAVFMCGMLVALLTCGYEVYAGHRNIGEFTTLVTYLGQLQGPLNFFGTFYRTVQQAMISGERLLELFKIQPTVIDAPHVRPLPTCEGHIKWNNVGFAYDGRRPALQDLSFECKPGTTTAFVGESGGGKSTVFRLMFRYYNCREGSIEMDGIDVKDLTIDSVRRVIGVVPQDTILFNETLMYNLKYANPSVTEEDVYEACRAAAIHDRIMGFPDGYNTKVGERGLRLSGGEKQRVAIARTILKNPKVIMLDEATSALDGETEQKIQSKLISGKFGQDRTLLIIAHRLSTITHADQIIVLHAGTIAEKGTHEELLARNGRYAAMWEKHCRAERAAEHARDATRKAKKLLSQANISRPDELSNGYDSMVSSRILPTAPDSPPVMAETRDNASISLDDGHSSDSGSDGTLQDEPRDESTVAVVQIGGEEHRPLLYSFPSGTTAAGLDQA